jgi:hypothetical protein
MVASQRVLSIVFMSIGDKDMKVRIDYVTNSSSASFIIATNLNDSDMFGRIFNLDMPIADKYVLKELMTNRDNLVAGSEVRREVLQVLHHIIPLDEDADDYIEMSWMDAGTGNIRYKHISVYRVEQGTPEWRVLFDLLKKFSADKEIFVWQHYWGG